MMGQDITALELHERTSSKADTHTAEIPKQESTDEETLAHVSQPFWKRSMKHRYKKYVVSSAGILVVLFGVIYLPGQHKLAVVDMNAIISHRAQQVIQAHGEKVTSQTLQAVHAHLKEDLNAYAASHNITLLAKGSVVGGDLPDYTQDILETFEEGERR